MTYLDPQCEEQAKIFALGNFFFRLSSSNHQLKSDLERLFLPVKGYSGEPETLCLDEPQTIASNWQRHVVADGTYDLIRLIGLRAVEEHPNAMTFNGAVLVAPGDRSVLISGDMGSGKTTLALAACTVLGWKAVTEDVVLIDPERSRVLSFPCPHYLRSGTLEAVGELTDNPAPISQYKSWVPLACPIHKPCIPAQFDAVVHLRDRRKANSQPHKIEELPAPSYVRELIKRSNLIKLGAADIFASYISREVYYEMSGGSLSERLETIKRILS